MLDDEGIFLEVLYIYQDAKIKLSFPKKKLMGKNILQGYAIKPTCIVKTKT